jgi:hypothetical protein
MRDHSGEQSGMYRGVRTVRVRIALGCVFALLAIATLIFVPCLPTTVGLHIAGPIVFGLLAVGFFVAAAIRPRR